MTQCCNICKRNYKNIKSHIHKTKKHKVNSITFIQRYFQKYTVEEIRNVSSENDLPYEICCMIFEHLPFLVKRCIDNHHYSKHPRCLLTEIKVKKCEIMGKRKRCSHYAYRFGPSIYGKHQIFFVNGNIKTFESGEEAYLPDDKGVNRYCCRIHFNVGVHQRPYDPNNIVFHNS